MILRRLFWWWALSAHVLLFMPSFVQAHPSFAAIGTATSCGSSSAPVQPVPTINEFLPDPTSGTEWVELYNPHDTPLLIGGLKIDDAASNSTNPKLIPAGTTIAAHGFCELLSPEGDSFSDNPIL